MDDIRQAEMQQVMMEIIGVMAGAKMTNDEVLQLIGNIIAYLVKDIYSAASLEAALTCVANTAIIAAADNAELHRSVN